MCGTAPVTPPTGAFELEIEESHWDKVYHAIELLETQGSTALQQYLKKLETESRTTKTKGHTSKRYGTTTTTNTTSTSSTTN